MPAGRRNHRPPLILRLFLRDLDAVPPGDFEHQFGLEAAFDMQMQLRLGQAADEFVGTVM
jgi:hypothetical protein